MIEEMQLKVAQKKTSLETVQEKPTSRISPSRAAVRTFVSVNQDDNLNNFTQSAEMTASFCKIVPKITLIPQKLSANTKPGRQLSVLQKKSLNQDRSSATMFKQPPQIHSSAQNPRRVDLAVSTSLLRNKVKPGLFQQQTRFKVQRGTSTSEVNQNIDMYTEAATLEPSRQLDELVRMPSEKKYTLNYFGNIDNQIGQMQTQVRLVPDSLSNNDNPTTQRTENLFGNQAIPDNFYNKIQMEPFVVNAYSRTKALPVVKITNMDPGADNYAEITPNGLNEAAIEYSKRLSRYTQSSLVNDQKVAQKNRRAILRGSKLRVSKLERRPYTQQDAIIKSSSPHHIHKPNNQLLPEVEKSPTNFIRRSFNHQQSTQEKVNNSIPPIYQENKLNLLRSSINKMQHFQEAHDTNLGAQAPAQNPQDEVYLQYLKYKNEKNAQVLQNQKIQDKISRILDSRIPRPASESASKL